MVRRIRNPSRNVRSLLCEPGVGRDKASPTSAIGSRSSSACTVSSVSVSKPVGEGRERLDESPRHHAKARQHVADAVAEDRGHRARQQPVAERVPRSIGELRRATRAALTMSSDLLSSMLDHRRARGRVVRAVAVHEHVGVRLDVGEHAPDDIAFALQRLLRTIAPAAAAIRACRRSSCCRRRRPRRSATRGGNLRRRQRSPPARCSTESAPRLRGGRRISSTESAERCRAPTA